MSERRAARWEAAEALESKPAWKFVTNECCVADVGHCFLVRTKVSTANNPKGRPATFAFHREARALFAQRCDGYTSGEVGAVNVDQVPARLRAALACGLTMDQEARDWMQERKTGKSHEPAERAESEATVPPTTPKPVTLAVRKDEKRMTLVQRTFTVELPQARLLDLVRSTGADIPADAQVQIMWGDQQERPHMGRGDGLLVTWSRSEETVES